MIGAPLSVALLWATMRLDAYYTAILPHLTPAQELANIAGAMPIFLPGAALILVALFWWGDWQERRQGGWRRRR